MNYITVDLKVIEVKAPGVARAMGIEVATVIGALSLIWHRCWSLKSDFLTTIELRGYFQHPEAGVLLEGFQLLEAVDGGWRVKGADRYLRISEQRSKAGKSRSSSAGRSAGRFTSKSPANQPAADQRATSGGPALTPNTEHRTPKELPTADPRLKPLTERLVATFLEVKGSKYLYAGLEDTAALKRLIAVADDAEIDRRWRAALKAGADWPGASSIAQLAGSKRWNDLAGVKPAHVSIEHQPSRIF